MIPRDNYINTGKFNSAVGTKKYHVSATVDS